MRNIRRTGAQLIRAARSTEMAWRKPGRKEARFRERMPFPITLVGVEVEYAEEIREPKLFVASLILHDASGKVLSVRGWTHSQTLDAPFKYLPAGQIGWMSVSHGYLAASVVDLELRLTAWGGTVTAIPPVLSACVVAALGGESSGTSVRIPLSRVGE